MSYTAAGHRSARSLACTGRLIAAAAVALLMAAPLSASSVADEVGVGKRVMAEARPLGLTDDPSLDAIGKRLGAVVTRKDLPWRFWVIENLKEYNALAAPGGFVFITRVYYEKLNDDEAAFVLGHEMAHVDLRHHQKEASREQRANIGNLLLKVLTNATGVWGTAADLGATAYMTHYSRVLEREADLAGYHYASAAGYDAQAAVSALSKLGKEPRMHPWVANIYATHPILSSREDQLAALGGKAPQDVPTAPPAPSHKLDLTAGLEPFKSPVPAAVRILAPDGKRWENKWRKSFTQRLHQHLTPLGFRIVGDDLMYKPDIGDLVAAAQGRGARYLLLVTVQEMQSAATGPEELAGTPVRAKADVTAKLVDVITGEATGEETRFSQEKAAVDVLPADEETLQTDAAVGQVAEAAAGEVAAGAARAAGAQPTAPDAKGKT